MSGRGRTDRADSHPLERLKLRAPLQTIMEEEVVVVVVVGRRGIGEVEGSRRRVEWV